MVHPHVKSIEKMNPAQLVAIVDESRISYIQENLDIHLHESEIKLLKQIIKHQKPHHKKIRIKKYQKASKTDLFKLHEKLYLKKYQKLESKDLVKINLNPDNGLPYDCELTQKGIDLVSQINEIEKLWEDKININDDTIGLLKELALNSFEISYNHKKNLDFNF